MAQPLLVGRRCARYVAEASDKNTVTNPLSACRGRQFASALENGHCGAAGARYVSHSWPEVPRSSDPSLSGAMCNAAATSRVLLAVAGVHKDRFLAAFWALVLPHRRRPLRHHTPPTPRHCSTTAPSRFLQPHHQRLRLKPCGTMSRHTVRIGLALMAMAAAVAASASAHSSITGPSPISTMKSCKVDNGRITGNCPSPCPVHDKKSRAPVTTTSRGARLPTRWYRNNHVDGFVRWTLVPLDKASSWDAHKKGTFEWGCYESGTYKCSRAEKQQHCTHDNTGRAHRGTVEVPKSAPDGEYMLGWTWIGGHNRPRTRTLVSSQIIVAHEEGRVLGTTGGFRETVWVRATPPAACLNCYSTAACDDLLCAFPSMSPCRFLRVPTPQDTPTTTTARGCASAAARPSLPPTSRCSGRAAAAPRRGMSQGSASLTSMTLGRCRVAR